MPPSVIYHWFVWSPPGWAGHLVLHIARLAQLLPILVCPLVCHHWVTNVWLVTIWSFSPIVIVGRRPVCSPVTSLSPGWSGGTTGIGPSRLVGSLSPRVSLGQCRQPGHRLACPRRSGLPGPPGSVVWVWPWRSPKISLEVSLAYSRSPLTLGLVWLVAFTTCTTPPPAAIHAAHVSPLAFTAARWFGQ